MCNSASASTTNNPNDVITSVIINSHNCNICKNWDNIDSFIDKKNFVAWKTQGIQQNCFEYALAELKKSGYRLNSLGWWDSTGKKVNPDIFQIYIAKDVAGLSAGEQKNNFEKAIIYLKDAMKKKFL